MTGRPRAARLRRGARPRALVLALAVALPAGGLVVPASAAADGELPAAPDPVPVAAPPAPDPAPGPAPAPAAPAPAAAPEAPAPSPGPAPIAGLPTLPAVQGAAVAEATVSAAVAAPAVAASVTVALRPLRIGAVGLEVEDLQRALRKHGDRVAVDGAFGRGTRAAVKRLQRRMHRPPTGVADVVLLKRLGIAPHPAPAQPAVASVPDITGAAVAGLALPGGAPPAPVSAEKLGARYLRTFPVAGPHSYSDDFGDPRPQGRHEGVDILSPMGTPVVAVADGTILRMSRVESGRGGITIWLRDTDGNVTFYAHLSAIADGLEEGSPVAVGEQIGAVGNTGDARGGPTHLHFEIHPGDGAAIDPFGELSAVDPDKAVQTPAARPTASGKKP